MLSIKILRDGTKNQKRPKNVVMKLVFMLEGVTNDPTIAGLRVIIWSVICIARNEIGLCAHGYGQQMLANLKACLNDPTFHPTFTQH